MGNFLQTARGGLFRNGDNHRRVTKTVTAKDALSKLGNGMRVFIGSGCAKPQTLVEALAEKGGNLFDIEIIHILTFGVAPYATKQLIESFRHNAFFIGPNVRAAVNEAIADYTPILLSEVPALFRQKKTHLDVALVRVTPPDRHGFCNFGVSVDVVKAAVESADYVVAEVNPNMPRTLGDSFVHMSQIDALAESNLPILEHPVSTPSAETRERRLVHPNQIALPAGLQPYPKKYESSSDFKRGLKVFFRPIQPTDKALLKELFYSHSEKTILHRYFTLLRHLPHEQVQKLVTLDLPGEGAKSKNRKKPIKSATRGQAS